MANDVSTTTVNGHVNRANDFYNKTVWFGIGRTTAWADENNPPAPDPTLTAVEEIIGYKKASEVSFIVPDEGGSVEFRGSTWTKVTQGNAFTSGARWIYVKAELLYTELPVDVSFREYGLFTNLVPASGYEAATALLPANVSNTGVMELISFQTKITRQSSQKETLEIIIEF